MQQDMFKHVLIIGFITTLLFTTITCGTEGGTEGGSENEQENVVIETLNITQANVDGFGNTIEGLLATASGNFIQAGESFTLTLSLSSLYSENSLTSSIPLTISFTSLHTDVTFSPTSYETTLADLNSDTLEWTITYSEATSPDMTYNVELSIMSEVFSSTLSTTLDLPSPTGDIFELGVGISPWLSLTGIEHIPVLVLSNLPRRSDFTYTLEQADDATFSSVTTTTLAHSNIEPTTFEYVLNDSLTSSDWGSTLTDHQFYRLSVYDSNNRFLTGGNTSDITETVLSTFVGNVSAVGDGSEANPYQISNVYQLQEMGTMPNLDKYFVLVNDIDATETVSWADGAGFNPIDACAVNDFCVLAQYFKGSLDGRGYTISNLYINRRDNLSTGLFGTVQGTSTQTVSIKNITLSVATINLTGTDRRFVYYAGSFVGFMNGYIELENLVVDTSSSLSLFVTSASSLASSSIGGLVGAMNNEENSINSSISYSILSSSISPLSTSIGGLVGAINRAINNEENSINSSISYSILSSSSSDSAVVGGLVGRMRGGSLSSNIAYSIISSSSPNVDLGGLVGYMNGAFISSSISYFILSSSFSLITDLNVAGLVGRMDDGGTVHSSLGSIQLLSVEVGAIRELNLGSLLGLNSGGTINNSYIDTSFLMLNENDTFRINPSTSELPLVDNNNSTVNCIAAFTYSETLSTTSGDAGACSDTDIFYNFATYDSNDEGTAEPDWNVLDNTFYPRPATMPSVFDISKLATQDEYRMMASHSLIRFYDGTPKDESGSDDIVDNANNVLFITHKSRDINSVDDLEEAYYEVNTNNIYISQGLDATLLRDDNTLYTNSATASTKFTYSFALTQDRTSLYTTSSSLTVNGVTLSLKQDTTGTYISGIASLSADDDFYVEVTVNSSTSVTATGNNTSFSRRYRFKKDSVVVVSPIYLSQIRFESRGNSSNVVTYDNDTEATAITITENPKKDSNVIFTFSGPVTGQAGFTIIFSNTVTCSSGYSGETVSGFTNTDTVLIDARRINYCSVDFGVSDTPTQMIIIPAGAFVSQDGTPLPRITIQFSIDT